MTDLERIERYRWEAVLREGYRLADAKRAMVQAALRLAQGNKTQAALRLGVSIRTMRNLVKRYTEHVAPLGDQ
jgi:DNA-binding NtrC family response regulator